MVSPGHTPSGSGRKSPQDRRPSGPNGVKPGLTYRPSKQNSQSSVHAGPSTVQTEQPPSMGQDAKAQGLWDSIQAASRMTSEIKTLETKLARRKAEAAVNPNSAELEKLQSDLTKARGELKTHEDVFKSVMTGMLSNKSEANKSEANKSEVTNSSNYGDRDSRSNQNEIAALRAEQDQQIKAIREEVQKSNDQAQASMKRRDAMLETLQRDVQSHVKANEELKAELRNLRMQAKDKEIMDSKLQASISDFAKFKSNTDRDLAVLRKRMTPIAAFQTALDAQGGAIEKLETLTDRLDDKGTKQQTSLGSVTAQLNDLETRIAALSKPEEPTQAAPMDAKLVDDMVERVQSTVMVKVGAIHDVLTRKIGSLSAQQVSTAESIKSLSTPAQSTSPTETIKSLSAQQASAAENIKSINEHATSTKQELDVASKAIKSLQEDVSEMKTLGGQCLESVVTMQELHQRLSDDVKKVSEDIVRVHSAREQDNRSQSEALTKVLDTNVRIEEDLASLKTALDEVKTKAALPMQHASASIPTNSPAVVSVSPAAHIPRVPSQPSSHSNSPAQTPTQLPQHQQQSSRPENRSQAPNTVSGISHPSSHSNSPAQTPIQLPQHQQQQQQHNARSASWSHAPGAVPGNSSPMMRHLQQHVGSLSSSHISPQGQMPPSQQHLQQQQQQQQQRPGRWHTASGVKPATTNEVLLRIANLESRINNHTLFLTAHEDRFNKWTTKQIYEAMANAMKTMYPYPDQVARDSAFFREQINLLSSKQRLVDGLNTNVKQLEEKCSQLLKHSKDPATLEAAKDYCKRELDMVSQALIKEKSRFDGHLKDLDGHLKELDERITTLDAKTTSEASKPSDSTAKDSKIAEHSKQMDEMRQLLQTVDQRVQTMQENKDSLNQKIEELRDGYRSSLDSLGPMMDGYLTTVNKIQDRAAKIEDYVGLDTQADQGRRKEGSHSKSSSRQTSRVPSMHGEQSNRRQSGSMPKPRPSKRARIISDDDDDDEDIYIPQPKRKLR